jgi:hypothetical protein
MRNLFSGRRRYALACLIAVGGLITAAASCQPTKQPVKEPAPTTIFSIEPTSWEFGSAEPSAQNPKTFTVTNNGPNTSGTLETITSGTDADNFEVAVAGPDNTCQGQPLASGETCNVQVSFGISGADGPKEADLVVSSNNADDGEAVANLTGTQV